jgi:hypothetical protein
VKESSEFKDKQSAALHTCRCVRALDYARQRGELPHYKAGKKVLYRTSDLDAWMERFRVLAPEAERKEQPK